MLKKILAGLTTAVLALGVVALVAGPASAHHNDVTATVVCSPTGYTVIWKVVNSEAQKSEKIVESSNESLVPVNTPFLASETKTFDQTVTAPQDLTLTLKGFWADGNVYTSNSGSVASSAFPTGCIETSPTLSTTQAQCDEKTPNTYTTPTYTIGGTGVVWYINYSTTATPAGTYNATVGVPIHAEAQPLDTRYKLTGQTVWDYTFQAPKDTCVGKVVPVTPTFEQQLCTKPGEHSLATYFIPTVTGVIYSVKVDGVEKLATPGLNKIPEGVKTIQVIARGDASKFYEIVGGAKVYDVFTVLPVGQCLTQVVPLKPSSVQAVCDTKANPGSVPDSTYTLTYVPHVIYQVSTDGAPAVDVVLTQTKTYTIPKPDSVVVVTARADDPSKYQTAAFSETLKFTDPGGCLSDLAYINPNVTQQFCDDSGLTGLDAATPDAASAAVTAAAEVGDPVTVPGSVTIPVTPNVEYFIDGSPATAGLYTLTPGRHVVSIKYDALKYQLAPGVTVPFEINIDGAPCLPTEPLVTPVAASSGLSCFSNGSVTLANDLRDPAAVVWSVNGVSSKQGTFPVTKNGTVTVSAAANAPAYGFGEGTQTSWTFTFTRPAGCDLQTLALTGQSPMGLLIAADLLVVAGLALIGVRVLRRNRDRLTVD